MDTTTQIRNDVPQMVVPSNDHVCRRQHDDQADQGQHQGRGNTLRYLDPTTTQLPPDTQLDLSADSSLRKEQYITRNMHGGRDRCVLGRRKKKTRIEQCVCSTLDKAFWEKHLY